MSYKVVKGFYDLQDPEGRSHHLYNKGDVYPREGLNPSLERIAELSGADNKRKQPLIEEILEAPVEDAEPAEVQAAPAEEAAPKKRGKKKPE